MDEPSRKSLILWTISEHYLHLDSARLSIANECQGVLGIQFSQDEESGKMAQPDSWHSGQTTSQSQNVTATQSSLLHAQETEPAALLSLPLRVLVKCIWRLPAAPAIGG